MPDAVITSDIIVGFPGETDEDFECTVKALERAKYDMIFSFIYSPRKGTPAAEMECQIEAEVKSRRFERLLQTQNEISLELNKKYEICLISGDNKNSVKEVAEELNINNYYYEMLPNQKEKIIKGLSMEKNTV